MYKYVYFLIFLNVSMCWQENKNHSSQNLGKGRTREVSRALKPTLVLGAVIDELQKEHQFSASTWIHLLCPVTLQLPASRGGLFGTRISEEEEKKKKKAADPAFPPLKSEWTCNLLSPVESGRDHGVPVPSLGLQRHEYFYSFFWSPAFTIRTSLKPETAGGWVTRWKRAVPSQPSQLRSSCTSL